MNEVYFPYEDWVTDSLREVLKRTLMKFSEEISLGDHHLYINFKTDSENVKIPEFLRVQYPEEITIVLQHQFKDLYLDDKGFEVTLSFNGQNQCLYIPFDAVTSFADPSVNFGIQIMSKEIESLADKKYAIFDNEKNYIDYKNKRNLAQNQEKSEHPSDNTDVENFSDQENKSEFETVGAKVIDIEVFRKR